MDSLVIATAITGICALLGLMAFLLFLAFVVVWHPESLKDVANAIAAFRRGNVLTGNASVTSLGGPPGIDEATRPRLVHDQTL